MNPCLILNIVDLPVFCKKTIETKSVMMFFKDDQTDHNLLKKRITWKEQNDIIIRY